MSKKLITFFIFAFFLFTAPKALAAHQVYPGKLDNTQYDNSPYPQASQWDSLTQGGNSGCPNPTLTDFLYSVNGGVALNGTNYCQYNGPGSWSNQGDLTNGVGDTDKKYAGQTFIPSQGANGTYGSNYTGYHITSAFFDQFKIGSGNNSTTGGWVRVSLYRYSGNASDPRGTLLDSVTGYVCGWDIGGENYGGKISTDPSDTDNPNGWAVAPYYPNSGSGDWHQCDARDTTNHPNWSSYGGSVNSWLNVNFHTYSSDFAPGDTAYIDIEIIGENYINDQGKLLVLPFFRQTPDANNTPGKVNAYAYGDAYNGTAILNNDGTISYTPSIIEKWSSPANTPDGDLAGLQVWANLIDGAQCVSISDPTPSGGGTLYTGEPFTAQVQMKNIGDNAWTTANSYKLGSQGSDWGFSRADLPTDPVNPGDTATFDLTGNAPSTAGSYNFDWQMLRENVHWFGDTCKASGDPIKVEATCQISGATCEAATPNSINIENIGLTDNSWGSTGISISRGGSSIATVGVGTTSYTDSSLGVGTTYDYDIACSNGSTTTGDQTLSCSTPTVASPSVSGLHVQAYAPGVAQGSYGASGQLSAESGSGYYNSVEIYPQITSNYTDTSNIALVATAFVESSGIGSTSFAGLLTSADNAHGFVMVYVNGSGFTLNGISQSFTQGKYYVYYNGTWNGPYNAGGRAIDLPSSAPVYSIQILAPESGTGNDATTPTFAVSFYKALGSRKWGTYTLVVDNYNQVGGYNKEVSVQTAPSPFPTP